jgi:UTP:GlnB (protein PII) uridylyltransferase
MPNRTLSPQELEKANALLQDIRTRLRVLAGEEADLLFAYRRKVAKELVYDERSKPGKRRLLKLSKMIAQKGLCAQCQTKLPKRGAELAPQTSTS